MAEFIPKAVAPTDYNLKDLRNLPLYGLYKYISLLTSWQYKFSLVKSDIALRCGVGGHKQVI